MGGSAPSVSGQAPPQVEEDLGEEVVLRREPAVERGEGDAGPLGHGLHDDRVVAARPRPAPWRPRRPGPAVRPARRTGSGGRRGTGRHWPLAPCIRRSGRPRLLRPDLYVCPECRSLTEPVARHENSFYKRSQADRRPEGATVGDDDAAGSPAVLADLNDPDVFVPGVPHETFAHWRATDPVQLDRAPRRAHLLVGHLLRRGGRREP